MSHDVEQASGATEPIKYKTKRNNEEQRHYQINPFKTCNNRTNLGFICKQWTCSIECRSAKANEESWLVQNRIKQIEDSHTIEWAVLQTNEWLPLDIHRMMSALVTKQVKKWNRKHKAKLHWRAYVEIKQTTKKIHYHAIFYSATRVGVSDLESIWVDACSEAGLTGRYTPAKDKNQVEALSKYWTKDLVAKAVWLWAKGTGDCVIGSNKFFGDTIEEARRKLVAEYNARPDVVEKRRAKKDKPGPVLSNFYDDDTPIWYVAGPYHTALQLLERDRERLSAGRR